jgi:uncharacterized membrane protein YbhN (UPF0104 family)
MSEDKRPLINTAVIMLIPLVLVCDVVVFAMCFWVLDVGLVTSSLAATLAPIVLLLGILLGISFRARQEQND